MPIEILETRIAPAGILVLNIADSGPGSLRNAITLANTNGDTSNDITFAHGLHGAIALKSSLPPITSNITFTVLSGSTVSINGGNQFQIFNIQGPQIAVNISDLTLTRGSSAYGGAIYVNDYMGTVKLAGCTITKNQALGSATSTHASGIGGAIDLQQGALDINASTISGNIAAGFAATTAYPTGGKAMGGGIYVYGAGALSVTNSTISGNVALGANGLIGTKGASGVPSSAGSYGTAGGNGAIAKGGGIWSYGSVTLANSIISGNKALGGKGGAGGAGGKGGTGAQGGNGGAGGYSGNAYGGGIFTPGSLTVNNSTISGNIASGPQGGRGGAGGRGGSHAQGGNGGAGGYSGKAFGGGIYSTGALTVNNSTISGNIASGALGGKGGAAGGASSRALHGAVGTTQAATAGYGGGIHTQNSTIKLVQDTIARNGAGQGGGLFVNMDTSATVDNSTIAFNKALQAGMGGGIWAYLDPNSDPITVISTAIGQNKTARKPVAGDDLFMSAGYITASYSLVESFTTNSVTQAVAGSVIENVSPLLGPLQNNGGPTLTCLPSLSRSPLLGAGFNPLTPPLTKDQRGDPREQGGTIDIGSVEVA